MTLRTSGCSWAITVTTVFAPAIASPTLPQTAPLKFAVTYDAPITNSYTGRVYIMLSRSDREPRFGPSWVNTDPFFAIDVENWQPGAALVFTDAALGYPGPASTVQQDIYSIQAVMRRSLDSPSVGNGPGTAYSVVSRQEVQGTTSGEIRLHIDQVVPPRTYDDVENDHLRLVAIRSDLLSAFYGRDITMQAAVALPSGYGDDDARGYPALYVIPGFGGNHVQATRWAHRMIGPERDDFIIVGLNPLCRTGHHVFADSANNGPRGWALIEELIPYLEQEFHLVSAPTARFLTGSSSGGWSSLWLQVTYADFFGGVWSIVPDPVDFRDFQRINLYETGANMYIDDQGNRRPIARFGDQPVLWYDDFAKMEVVRGAGGQLYSFEAVFSPRGPDGKPQPLYDRKTGAVKGDVAQAWKRYDIGLVLKENWPTLESKLTGKLRIFAGEKDTFYLEGAVRLLKQTLDELGSDAVIEILTGRNHMNVADRALGQRIHQELRAVFDKHHPQYATSTPQDATR